MPIANHKQLASSAEPLHSMRSYILLVKAANGLWAKWSGISTSFVNCALYNLKEVQQLQT